MLSEILSFILQVLEKALSWAAPFFLGKEMEKRKWEEGTRDAVAENENTRNKIHRDNVASSDASGSRDKLHQWTRSDD